MTAPRQLRLLTTEGVPVDLELGSAADRVAAFLIDLLLLVLLFVALAVVAVLTESLWLAAIAMSASLFVRVFWFVLFEARPGAATPGKRRLGLRVVRADGGPLSFEAVLTRNFTREIEVFVPLLFLASAEDFWPGHPGFVRLAAAGWIVVVATMPLWNRSRARLGDLVAGTRVVRVPRALLLGDLVRRAATGAQQREAGAPVFKPAQLGIYGIYELQVLEDVLRKARQPGGKEAVAAVAQRIRAKIGWDEAQGEFADEKFLEHFYAAQRKHLEQQLLFGKRKERKRG